MSTKTKLLETLAVLRPHWSEANVYLALTENLEETDPFLPELLSVLESVLAEANGNITGELLLRHKRKIAALRVREKQDAENGRREADSIVDWN